MTNLRLVRDRDEFGRYLPFAETRDEAIRERYAEEERGFGSPCWIWHGSLDQNGYGRFNGEYVHRIMCREEPPPGSAMHVDHLCRQPSCINPDHLELVTNGENIRRAYTHCKRGHEFTPENTYVRRDTGCRQCRACIRIRLRGEHRLAA